MKRLGLALLFSFAAALPVGAATLAFELVNSTGEDITSLTATLATATEPSTSNALAVPVSGGGSATISLEAGDGQCIFNLIFTLASGRLIDRPDTDLCQTDGIVVE